MLVAAMGMVVSAPAESDLYYGRAIQFGASSLDEGFGRFAFTRVENAGFSYGFGTGASLTYRRISESRLYLGGQAFFPVFGAVGGGILGIPFAMMFGPEAVTTLGGTFALIGSVLSDTELRAGWKYASLYADHRVDLFLPGLHPREKLSAGIQLGEAIAIRAGGYQSLSSVTGLNSRALEIWFQMGLFQPL